MTVHILTDVWQYMDPGVIEDYRIKGGIVEWHY